MRVRHGKRGDGSRAPENGPKIDSKLINTCFNIVGMDTVYPEPMSLLHRRVVPKKRRGSSARYRTQPVTFSEIQARTQNFYRLDAQDEISYIFTNFRKYNRKIIKSGIIPV